MDASHFDRVTKRFSRRATLRSGGLALATLASLGLAARDRVTRTASAAQATPEATPGGDDPNAMEIDGAWFCNQIFALCTSAPCELSESDPSIANCHCIVVTSYSIGFKTCTERAQSGMNLTSDFSTVNVNSAFRAMSCPEDAPWANCLDMPCEIDSLNPAVATCQCEMVQTGPSLTFGGGCDTSTCTSTIWSAAPPTYLGLEQYETGMQRVNQKISVPTTCPSATPAAATPASA